MLTVWDIGVHMWDKCFQLCVHGLDPHPSDRTLGESSTRFSRGRHLPVPMSVPPAGLALKVGRHQACIHGVSWDRLITMQGVLPASGYQRD